jgi:hypothetical protein
MLFSIFVAIFYSPVKDLYFAIIFLIGAALFGWDQHETK